MPKQKHHDFSRQDDELDEVFIRNASVHIERMDDTAFWIGIYPPESSGFPSIMLNTGVYKGEWFFNVEEDCLDGPRDFIVRRPRYSKRKLPIARPSPAPNESEEGK